MISCLFISTSIELTEKFRIYFKFLTTQIEGNGCSKEQLNFTVQGNLVVWKIKSSRNIFKWKSMKSSCHFHKHAKYQILFPQILFGIMHQEKVSYLAYTRFKIISHSHEIITSHSFVHLTCSNNWCFLITVNLWS